MRRDCWPPKRRFILIIHYGAASIIASPRNAATTRDYSDKGGIHLSAVTTTGCSLATGEPTR